MGQYAHAKLPQELRDVPRYIRDNGNRLPHAPDDSRPNAYGNRHADSRSNAHGHQEPHAAAGPGVDEEPDEDANSSPDAFPDKTPELRLDKEPDDAQADQRPHPRAHGVSAPPAQ